MNQAGAHSRSPLRRLALLIAAALTLGAAPAALAQQPGHREGGGGHGGGGPHMSGARMSGPRMPARMVGPPIGGARNPWGSRMAGPPPGRVYASPPNGYAPRGRAYPGPANPWAAPRANGAWAGYPVYASPPGYPAPAAPARAWRRGGYLPPSYPGVVVQNFARYHLRRPPDGYNWVREGNELLLVSAGTGLIFDVVPAY